MLRTRNNPYLALGVAVALALLAGQSLLGADEQAWQSAYGGAVRDLGLYLDVTPLTGAAMVSGTVKYPGKLRGCAGADEEILDLLSGVQRDYRMELCSPLALSHKSELAAVYGKLNAAPGQWGLLLSKPRGTQPLGGIIQVQDYFSWAPVHGITADKLCLIGPSGSGKTTLLGTVDNVAKFNATVPGFEGATKGDRVHIIPQPRGGWKLALCSKQDSILLRLTFGQTTLSLPPK
ncbi:MAG: hypothetical protein KKI08_11555 [Armatimonadetes bacterium]|nr:hypothetical protein [Armatimonadota bacterium]